MSKKICKKIWRTMDAVCSGVVWYMRDLVVYWRLMKREHSGIPFYFFPQLFDRASSSHTFDKHYVYMDRWAFAAIERARPREHVDVGSSIRFLSMASVVTRLKFVDIRP